jgi:hypothetical protein
MYQRSFKVLGIFKWSMMISYRRYKGGIHKAGRRIAVQND